LDHFDFKMLINAIRNAINNAIHINWVSFQKNAALYALKTLICWKKAMFYALDKLKYAKIQRYTAQKRYSSEKTIALRRK
jgi:hypothetical protein